MKKEKFDKSVGAPGMTITEASFLEALYHLESNNAKAPYTCTLHPVQVTDLRQALKSLVGAIWGGPSKEGANKGAFASLYGVDMYRSSDVELVNDGKDYQGAMVSADNKRVAIISKS